MSLSQPARDTSSNAAVWARAAWWVGAGLLALAYGFWLDLTPTDDAMITLGYARTLAQDGVFGPAPGVEHYGFTSPLQVIFLAATSKVVGIGYAIAVSTAIQLVLLLAVSRRLAGRLFDQPSLGVGLVLLIAANPLIASTFGLESLLAIVLLLTLIDTLLADRRLVAGLAVGGLILVRPDLGLTALAAPLLLQRLDVRRLSIVLAAAAVPVLLWHLYAWIALGSALPLTFLIKVSEGGWGTQEFAHGLGLYIGRYPLMTSLSLAPLAMLIGLLLPAGNSERRRPAALIALLSLTHWVPLTVLGVAPYHWYYVPGLALLLLAAWICFVDRLPTGGRQFWGSIAPAGLSVVALGAFLVVLGPRPKEPPIHSNWGSFSQYRAMAHELQEQLPPGARVGHFGEIGALSYFAGELRLLDAFTDPDWVATSAIPAGLSGSAPRRWFTQANFHFFRALPAAPTSFCLYGQRGDADSAAPERESLASWNTSTRWGSATWRLSDCPPNARRQARHAAESSLASR